MKTSLDKNPQINPYLDLYINQLIEHDKNLTAEEIHYLRHNQHKLKNAPLAFLRSAITNKDYFGQDLSKHIILLALLREEEALELIVEILSLPSNIINKALSETTDEYLPSILASISYNKWQKLKPIIENNEIDEWIRSACLHACAIMVACDDIPREEFVAYLKNSMKSEKNDAWQTLLAETALDIWPGECIEEIRELFGLRLIDTRTIKKYDMIDSLNMGKEACINKLKEEIDVFFKFITSENPKDYLEDKESSMAVLKIFKKLDNLKNAVNRYLTTGTSEKIGRNDPCPCSSNQKYKKCCLNKSIQPPETETEKITISFDALEDPIFAAIPKKDQDELTNLYHALQDGGHEAKSRIKKFIQKYPSLPTPYNYLYGIHVTAGIFRESMNILRETLVKFPDYLFSLAEYAHYYLRRGEPEMVPVILKNCRTIKQLYPHRDVFHESEVRNFSTIMALYFIETCDFKSAKMYLAMIKKINPNCREIELIEDTMHTKIYSMNESDIPQEILTLLK